MKNPSPRSLLMMTAAAVLFGSGLSAQAASYAWNVATPAANNWNVSGNWDVANFPGFGGSLTDIAIFGAVGTSSASNVVNNVVPANTTIATLNYTNTTAATWHVTQIPTGVTLTVSGATTVGFSQPVNGLVTLAAVNGAGTLALNGNLTVGNNGSSSADNGTTLDLSGLSTFLYNAPAANITSSTGNRSGADIRLAAGSNYIAAANMNLNSASSSSGASGTTYLGAGTNNINVGAISMASSRNNSTMVFGTTTGGLRLRGVGGTDADRASLLLANRNQNTSGGDNTGTMNFTGHPVDIKFSTVTIGQAQAATPTGAQRGIGIINFDSGTIDATTVLMAISSANAFNAGVATITVGTNVALGTSGTLIVGAGGLSLANQGALGTSTGTVAVVGGTFISSGPITKTTAAGIGNINITNGSFTASGTVGTLAIPLTSLVVTNSTLTLAASSSATNVVVTTLTALAGANNTVNISALPVIPTFPTQLPLIKYTAAAGDLSTFTLGSLPVANPVYQGYLSNNVTASSIDVVITNGPTPPPAAKPVVWDGQVSGNWDTTTTNWTTAGLLTNYVNLTIANSGDPVTFNDTLLGTTNVNLTQTLSPASVTVNNTLSNYLFTGSGKLSGTAALTKSGSGSLTFANTSPNDFTGGTSINGGTVQYGIGTTAGSPPTTGALVDNGSLVFNHSDSFTFSTAISGSGSLSQIGTGTLTLPTANTFAGGLTVSKGAVRATALNAAGTNIVTVNNGGTFVIGAALTNSFTLSNGIIGTSVTFTMNTNKEMIIADNSTNIIYSADPQSPATSVQFLVDGALRGSGTVLVINAPVTNPDGGQGVRFRTNTLSDFSGTIIYTNGSKGEINPAGADGATYSPIGTGKLVLYCGDYYGTNSTLCPTNGGYSVLNLKNNGLGSVTLGNDVSLMGTGAAVMNAFVGSNGVTMGNLKIGSNQELIGYKASTTPIVTNVVIFPTVTLAGNATFTPHSTSYGATTQFGSDFSLGPITETIGGSSITKSGVGNLTLTGVNNYTGNTTISNGTLFLSGTASIATSPNIIVGSGATLDVTNLSSTFALGAAQTLSNITSTAAISGNADASLGTISLRYASATPSFTVLNGALTLASGTAVKVNNTGSPLLKGSYRLISAGTAGSVAGTAPSSVTVGGNGTAGAVTPSLAITSSELFLVVPNASPAVARIVTNSTSSGTTWKIAISNLTTAAGWTDADGDAITLSVVGPTSNLGNSVTKDSAFVYYNAAVTAEDFFSYTISDGTATANGTVYLEATGAPPAPANANLIVTDGNGVPTITFAGIPGRTNVVEASTNLTLWTAISTNVAGTNGLWQVTDPDATNFVNRFYRSYQPYP
jgi:fibronectin-binding autotransporter adhesin